MSSVVSPTSPLLNLIVNYLDFKATSSSYLFSIHTYQYHIQNKDKLIILAFKSSHKEGNCTIFNSHRPICLENIRPKGYCKLSGLNAFTPISNRFFADYHPSLDPSRHIEPPVTFSETSTRIVHRRIIYPSWPP